MNFDERLCKYRRILGLPVLGHQVTLLSEMPGNIGDHLIQLGTEKLLDSLEIAYTKVSTSVISETQGDVLVVPGSGAWSTRWHEWLPDLVINASNQFNKIVIMPSSYDPEVKVVAKALMLPNVFPFAREVGSYSRVKSFAKVELGFDPALYSLDKVSKESFSIPSSLPSNTLIALRQDEGSLVGEKGFSVNPEMNLDISLACLNLEQFLKTIQEHDAVVTDRLHVAVASFLLGKPLICVDPYDFKISTYFDFVLRESQSQSLSLVSYDWLHANGIIIGLRS